MAYQVPDGYPEELTKYAKMLKFGIGEEAVRLKLENDGFDASMFDEYLHPDSGIGGVGAGFAALDKNIFDNDSDNDDNEKDNNDSNESERIEEKQEFEDVSTKTNSNTRVRKGERARIRKINYQTSLMNDPSRYGSMSFSQTNFVPDGNSQLKLDTLQPVPVKKTLLIVNTFVVNTAAFLNKFVATCESKLHKIHTDITRMETTLNILEGKLNSINWLGDAESGNLPNIPTAEQLQDADFNEENANVAPPPVVGTNEYDGLSPPAPPPEPAVDPVKNDPALTKWFKMLKVGVPEQAVRNKMAGEASDDIIDRVIEIHRTG